jgi:NDP-sugar pyrophosphorylase family protein
MSRPIEQVPVAILAGGLATRLRPVTEKIPKSLLPVAGRPFLAHQLELLKSNRLQRAVLCLGYLGEQVQQEFGNGRDYGVQLDYSFDGPVLLGTGGALKQALPKLGPIFFVLYGDSYLPIDFASALVAFEAKGKPGLMTVFKNAGRYDSSNVCYADGEIRLYDKKHRVPEMEHIDYGLSIFSSSIFDEFPSGIAFDLSEVMQRLLGRGQLAGLEVHQRFYEIGSFSGLKELEELLRSGGVPKS